MSGIGADWITAAAAGSPATGASPPWPGAVGVPRCGAPSRCSCRSRRPRRRRPRPSPCSLGPACVACSTGRRAVSFAASSRGGRGLCCWPASWGRVSWRRPSARSSRPRRRMGSRSRRESPGCCAASSMRGRGAAPAGRSRRGSSRGPAVRGFPSRLPRCGTVGMTGDCSGARAEMGAGAAAGLRLNHPMILVMIESGSGRCSAATGSFFGTVGAG